MNTESDTPISLEIAHTDTPRDGPRLQQAQQGATGEKRQSLEVARMLITGFMNLERDMTEARKTPVPQDVLDAYKENSDVISRIYGNDHVNPGLLYHGTGALQYNGNKFKEGTTDDLRHPLDSILEEGLKPHHDTWILGMGKEGVYSTSFATAWPYARWYADKHQSPDVPVLWEYGDANQWFSYYLADTFLTEFKQALRHPRAHAKFVPQVASRIRRYIGNMRKSNYTGETEATKGRQWVHDIRHDVSSSTPAIELIRGRTDIPGNFGAMVTVNRKDVELFNMGKGRVYEERTESEVVPNRFASLAVPMEKLAEYRERVRDLHLVFPVLPIEAVDYHFSQFPLRELTSGLRIK